MDMIEKYELQIRDLINQPWKRHELRSDKSSWNMLCSSLDVIGDTQEAFKYYYDLPEFEEENNGYIYLYGLLQAYFLQQDAVNSLSHVLLGKKIDWKIKYSEIYRVRELRNDAIGHPTSRNDGTFHSIARFSISKYRFILKTDDPKSDSPIFRDVNLLELHKNHDTSICEILNNIVTHMSNNNINHKLKFKGKKMIELIPSHLDYCATKLYQAIHADYPLASLDLSIILKYVDDVKNGIADRYGSISEVGGFMILITKIDYILKKIDEWIQNNQLRENRDAEIFVDGLSDRLVELKEMLIEIDKEFE